MQIDCCSGCGQVNGVPEYDDKLRDIYHRIRDGRSTWEPLVFTGEEFHEDEEGSMLAMERNMAQRGLCVTCSRPDLRGVDPDDVMSEDDAREMHEMWAEQAAEIRAGC